MATVITPTDGALATLTLGRDPDKGNGLVDDSGQVLGRSDGTKVWVYRRAQRVRRYTFTITGLNDAEWEALDSYVETVLHDSLETFTLEHAGLAAGLDDMRFEQRPAAVAVRDDCWNVDMAMRQEVPA